MTQLPTFNAYKSKNKSLESRIQTSTNKQRTSSCKLRMFVNASKWIFYTMDIQYLAMHYCKWQAEQ
jgi:hypothetical protein